ncbi:MAG: DUF4263 domain-containing protein [Calditrichaeota bacterium]|nr:MAG: DUF4263 domain-containing protein [Calditrichota bacterium]MBL1208152.1 DUF4263 domain-containing protein [Calditrichota bacterium]NOG47990.1 DUF4263 domain-containing protein [Calditrichota bacterium]
MGKINPKITLDDFSILLNKSKKETEIQSFLEKFPFLLTSGYYPESGAVISQLPLGADFRVDFAYLVVLNGGDFLHLVEIERPDLEMFTSKDEFSQEFNHAVQQIHDWAQWCSENREYLINVLQQLINGGRSRFRPYPRLTLIAGRRKQLSNDRRKRRYTAKSNALSRDMNLSTYDDLIDSLGFARYGDISRVNVNVKTHIYSSQGFKPK